MGDDRDYPMSATSATPKRRQGDRCPFQRASDTTDPGGRADDGCRFVIEQLGPVRTVRVLGRLDWTTADRFSQVIDEDLMTSPVIVDLTEAQLDPAGTGSLVAATLRSKERSQPMVVVVTDPVEREVLGVLGLADIVPVVYSIDEAERELQTIAVAGSY